MVIEGFKALFGGTKEVAGLARDVVGALDDLHYSEEEKAKILEKTNERAAARAERGRDRLAESDKSQNEVNKIGAAHRSVFVAGWRPGMGWVGVISIALMVLGTLSMTITLTALALSVDVSHIAQGDAEAVRAAIEANPLIIKVRIANDIWQQGMNVAIALVVPIITGMLGLGLYRTYEKYKGVAR